MAENRRYYWLKLKEDFFDDDAIEWLEEQPNGKEYSLFYLKLCLKSLKTDGILIRTVGNMLIPYDLKKLSDITKTDFDTVTVAMELLKRIGLVEIWTNGEIFLPGLQDMVGSETKWAKYKRNDKKLENVQFNSNSIPKKLQTEIEKDIEKENRINYQLIADMYNDICISFPQITKLSDKRKKAIKARISQGYSIDDFKRLFELAESSKFLKGGNSRNWSASFDWLIADANMAKTLDGNYSDRKKRSETYGNQSESSFKL